MSDPKRTAGPKRVYVGWDSAQVEAFQVCRHSLHRHARSEIEVIPIKQHELREQKLYWRPVDPLASTEFTYTRFLVPRLAGYQGWALFMDCDFLVTGDIGEVFDLADDRYALRCVQHDYRPTETTKMDGAVQSVYPRKNWSSFVLWNCGHPANAVVSPTVANRESGAYLHRFTWLEDDLIGDLPMTWNWLEGWYAPPEEGTPMGIHFTRGGPWFEDWRDVAYADLWRAEAELVRSAERGGRRPLLPR